MYVQHTDYMYLYFDICCTWSEKSNLSSQDWFSTQILEDMNLDYESY